MKTNNITSEKLIIKYTPTSHTSFNMNYDSMYVLGKNMIDHALTNDHIICVENELVAEIVETIAKYLGYEIEFRTADNLFCCRKYFYDMFFNAWTKLEILKHGVDQFIKNGRKEENDPFTE